MAIYINGISCISPQKTFLTDEFLDEPIDYNTPYLNCVEPVYKDHINPILARRLSRYIKMGVTTALTCLKDAGCEMPGAIITGTGLGSTEDNEKILNAMYENQERMINPTHFIQSTHNTISSQIAIMLKCHNYNNTYVHRGFSFESALLDGILLINEGLAQTALIGGVDALTEGHYKNYERIHRWKSNVKGSLKMIASDGTGVIPGEGSAYFLLSQLEGTNTYARLNGVKIIYKPRNAEEAIFQCKTFLAEHNLLADDIDLLITGMNGDSSTDHYYIDLGEALFTENPKAAYKHLCGEYETASGFALWLAARIIKNQKVPKIIVQEGNIPTAINNLLIYTHHRGDQHSLFLLSRI
jgi:3-oxoacyl-[acyl-carrier-protein] synthase II